MRVATTVDGRVAVAVLLLMGHGRRRGSDE
jgi:hypothetical protein